MSSEILSTLLLEYDQKKRKAELDSENRKEQLYIKYPRLQEIETELNNFAINVAKNIFANWEKIFSLLRKLFFLVGKIHQPQKAF